MPDLVRRCDFSSMVLGATVRFGARRASAFASTTATRQTKTFTPTAFTCPCGRTRVTCVFGRRRKMVIDPRSLGARCDVCPLGPEGCLRDGHWTPVPTEYHDGDEGIAVVGHPSSDEEQAGHQFAGDQGGEWSAGLIAAGSHRTKFAITPTILCRPPGDEKGAHDRMVKTLDKMNKARAKEGKDPIPSPESCCRPRLFNEISCFERIICLGGKAFKAVCGESRSVTKARGDLIEFTDDWRRLRRDPETQALMIGNVSFTGVVGHKVFVTLGADYIQHAPGWRHDWRMDLGKAIRWFEGRLRWVEPELLLRPSPAELRRWLDVPAPFWVVDVETDGTEPLETYLRDIGIATPDVDRHGKSVMPGAPFDRIARSVGISLLGGDGEKRWMTPEDEAKILDILRDFLTDPRTSESPCRGPFASHAANRAHAECSRRPA